MLSLVQIDEAKSQIRKIADEQKKVISVLLEAREKILELRRHNDVLLQAMKSCLKDVTVAVRAVSNVRAVYDHLSGLEGRMKNTIADIENGGIP